MAGGCRAAGTVAAAREHMAGMRTAVGEDLRDCNHPVHTRWMNKTEQLQRNHTPHRTHLNSEAHTLANVCGTPGKSAAATSLLGVRAWAQPF
eukprot:SAG11_NODE_2096_length_3832_cov_2.091347_3_plen_92_part_00